MAMLANSDNSLGFTPTSPQTLTLEVTKRSHLRKRLKKTMKERGV